MRGSKIASKLLLKLICILTLIYDQNTFIVTSTKLLRGVLLLAQKESCYLIATSFWCYIFSEICICFNCWNLWTLFNWGFTCRFTFGTFVTVLTEFIKRVERTFEFRINLNPTLVILLELNCCFCSRWRLHFSQSISLALISNCLGLV